MNLCHLDQVIRLVRQRDQANLLRNAAIDGSISVSAYYQGNRAECDGIIGGAVVPAAILLAVNEVLRRIESQLNGLGVTIDK